MTIQQLNKAKQTLGFFSMTVAWSLMNLIHSCRLAWTHGQANESGVVIFWSGLFIAIAWAVFVIYPLDQLDHSRQIFKPTVFPFIAGLYGVLTYSLIVGGLFRNLQLVLTFMPLALLTGLVFGFTYSQLIRSDMLVDFLVRRPFTKLVFFLSPVIILLFFLWVLPTIAPSLVFRYMPNRIRYKIVARTIPKFNVGDDFKPLQNALPGYFGPIDNGSGNMSASLENFGFVLQVHGNKIIRLEYGKDPNDYERTMYEKLHGKPCL